MLWMAQLKGQWANSAWSLQRSIARSVDFQEWPGSRAKLFHPLMFLSKSDILPDVELTFDMWPFYTSETCLHSMYFTLWRMPDARMKGLYKTRGRKICKRLKWPVRGNTSYMCYKYKHQTTSRPTQSVWITIVHSALHRCLDKTQWLANPTCEAPTPRTYRPFTPRVEPPSRRFESPSPVLPQYRRAAASASPVRRLDASIDPVSPVPGFVSLLPHHVKAQTQATQVTQPSKACLQEYLVAKPEPLAAVSVQTFALETQRRPNVS